MDSDLYSPGSLKDGYREKSQNPGDRLFCVEIDSSQPQKWSKNRENASNISIVWIKSAKMSVKTCILSNFLRIREIRSSVRETGRYGLYP